MDEGTADVIQYVGTTGLFISSKSELVTFDYIFPSEVSQKSVFESIGLHMIDDILLGYNSTLFGYGQTGSGKTYSMMGVDIYDLQQRGIIPRAVEELFYRVNNTDSHTQWTFKCSMVEIYKEKLNDLLEPQQVKLEIKEDSRKGIYVEGLKQVCVENLDELLQVIALGEQSRATAATHWNAVSSRSHQIFMLEVEQLLEDGTEKRGILNLIDLAGSEKVTYHGISGNVLEEAKKINLSLSALGNVIYALTQGRDHIPYRDSKLTRLLQESLGGNYKTTVLVTLSPCNKAVEETLNTLKFAQRVKTVKNCAKVNVKRPVEEYMEVITKLREKLGKAHHENSELREKLALTAKGTVELPQFDTLGSESDFFGVFRQEGTVNIPGKRTNSDENPQITIQKTNFEGIPSDLKALNSLKEELSKAKLSLIKTETVCHQLTEENQRLQLDLQTSQQETDFWRKKTEIMTKTQLLLVNCLQELEEKLKKMEEIKDGKEYKFEKCSENSEITADIEDIWTASLFDSEKVDCVSDTPYVKNVQRVLANGDASELLDFKWKCGLVKAAEVNCGLGAVVHTLAWKNALLHQKYKLLKQKCRNQGSRMMALEGALDSLHESQIRLAKQVSSLRLDNPLSGLSESQSHAFVRKCVRMTSVIDHKAAISPPMPRFTSEENVTQDFTSGLHLNTIQHISQALEHAQLETQQYQQLVQTIETRTKTRIHKELTAWSRCVVRMRNTYERELLRKQREVEKLNKLVGVWAEQAGDLGTDATVVVLEQKGGQGKIEKIKGDDGTVETEEIE